MSYLPHDQPPNRRCAVLRRISLGSAKEYLQANRRRDQSMNESHYLGGTAQEMNIGITHLVPIPEIKTRETSSGQPAARAAG